MMKRTIYTDGSSAVDLNGSFDGSFDGSPCGQPFASQSAAETETDPVMFLPCDLPTDRKYCIGIEEAARYYGIGTKKLRQIIAEHPTDNFYLEIGRHVLLKRKQFEAWLDDATAL